MLASLPADQQSTVYNDPNFGMNTVFKLTFWILANEGGDTSDAWIQIVAYYAKLNIDLSSAMY